MKPIIHFETGTIDPRNGCFDHHGAVEHKNNFICKMASVQLIEYLIITEQLGDFDPGQVKLNHVGHLDDFVMHAIKPAVESWKIRTLYALACRLSSIDTLGPTAYKLLNEPTSNIARNAYDFYQQHVRAKAKLAECPVWELPLADKRESSRLTGEFIVSELASDVYEEREIETPDLNTYRVNHRSGDVWSVEGLGNGFNVLRYAPYFYNQGCVVLIGWFKKGKVEAQGIDRYAYSISAKSAYHADLSSLWDILSHMEADYPSGVRLWGGHSGAGGSPRKQGNFVGGSIWTPMELLETVKTYIKPDKTDWNLWLDTIGLG